MPYASFYVRRFTGVSSLESRLKRGFAEKFLKSGSNFDKYFVGATV